MKLSGRYTAEACPRCLVPLTVAVDVGFWRIASVPGLTRNGSKASTPDVSSVAAGKMAVLRWPEIGAMDFAFSTIQRFADDGATGRVGRR